MPGRSPRTVLPLVVFPLAALLAVLPMLLRGPSCGHDFDFHLLSWLEVASQIAHGAYPHWAYTPAFNAGEPRFLFYPPLSWLLGGFLGIALPWAAVPLAFVWITLTLAGATFYRLARSYASPAPATLAAIIYLANPYMLFTAYERSAFAELLAAAWLPLLLAAALPGPAPAPSTPRQIVRIALPLALIWLTNAPAAVMFTYALAFLTLARLIARTSSSPASSSPGRLRLALTTSAGTALGLALAAFYIVPAAYERRFVQIGMVVIEGMRVNDHFLFHRMTGHTADDLFHDAVVRTASWVAVALLVGIFAVLPLALRRLRPFAAMRRIILPLALLTAVIAFLLTPLSLPLWHILPQMQFLQFPWRLGSLLGAIFALAVALAVPANRLISPKRTVSIALLAAAALILPAYLTFHQACDAEDAVPARVALFNSDLGTEPTDEYTPAGADPEALHPRDPPYWLLYGPDTSVNGPAPLRAEPGQAPSHFDINVAQPGILILNRRAYPSWRIFRNYQMVTSGVSVRDDGLIALSVPPGTSHIDLEWQTQPDQWIGDAVSSTALAVLILIWDRRSLTHTL